MALTKIKEDSPCGPDKIPSLVLKTCAASLAPSISAFFNFSLRKGVSPDAWKLARVISVFKSGPSNNISNYRPISFNCVLSKILERLIVQAVLSHLKDNKYINASQHGFLPGRSCITLLVHVLDDWLRGLDKKGVKQIDIVSLDWSKAFDTVPHLRLVAKIHKYNITGYVKAWLSSFISDRLQYVVYGNVSSSQVPVTSGVCQGSVLGPLLFILFMLDFPSCVYGPVVQCADNTSIYREISLLEDVASLQEDLNSIHLWCQLNEMKLNPLKSVHLRVSRSISPIISAYTINGSHINQVPYVKILGIMVSSDLKWSLHVDMVRKKASRTLGFLAKCFKAAKSSITCMLFKSLVRSKLVYGAPAWNPTTLADLSALERVQSRATRLILGCKKSDPRSRAERRTECGLVGLAKLRERVTLSFFCRCLLGIYDMAIFSAGSVSVRARREGLRGDRCVLTTPRSTSSQYLASFFPRAVALFNALPEETKVKHVPNPVQ